jgi:ketosteroid isomerase-like protein
MTELLRPVVHEDGIQRTELLQLRKQTLRDFAAAWDARDVDHLMRLMTDDCVYLASVGPEPGRTYVGAVAVREGFRKMLAHDADGESRAGRTFIAGQLAVAEWSYLKHCSSGPIVEIRGCDILEFRSAKNVSQRRVPKILVTVMQELRDCNNPWWWCT